MRDSDPLCPHIYAYDVELRYTSCIVLLQEGTLEDCLNKTFKQFKSKDQRYSQSFFALYVWLVLLYTGVSGKMRCGDEEGNREDELHDVVYLCFLILFIMQETLLNITRHTPTYSSVANLFCTLCFQFLVRKKVQESAHNKIRREYKGWLHAHLQRCHVAYITLHAWLSKCFSGTQESKSIGIENKNT